MTSSDAYRTDMLDRMLLWSPIALAAALMPAVCLAREEAAAELKRLMSATQLTVADITTLIEQLGGIVTALKSATAEERAEIYDALALKLTLNQLRAWSE